MAKPRHGRVTQLQADGPSSGRSGVAGDFKDIPQRLTRMEATLKKILLAVALPKPEAAKDVHTRAAEERMRFALGTRVRIARKGNGGRIEIDFCDENELQRLYEQLTERT